MVILTGDTKKLVKLRGLIEALSTKGYRDVNNAASEAVLKRVLDGFDRGVDPEEDPWDESIRVQEKGGKTLKDREFLYKSFKVRPDQAGFMLFVSNKDARKSTKYAWVHNEGLTIRAKRAPYMRFRVYRPDGRWVSKDTVVIPRRQFVPDQRIPDKWLKRMFDQINRKVGKQFGVTP
jgi:hypothetical protein